MYQPGERGELTGIAYYVSGDARRGGRATRSIRVKLVDPNNNSTKLGTVQTDAYGVFSLPITFSKQQALGYYTVDAKGANGNDISGSLRVAEFKPPNFKLTLSVNAKSATAGSSVQAQVAADYLFGAPLAGRQRRTRTLRATSRPYSRKDGTIIGSGASGSGRNRRRRSIATCCSATLRSTPRERPRSTSRFRATLPSR